MLASKEDFFFFEAVRLYCSFTHGNETVIEGCYLYCYAIKLLIVDGCSKSEAYNRMKEESERRANVSGYSTIKYWIENDIEIDPDNEMPKPHFRPISYIKISLLWAFYYLKHEYELNDALRDILKRGGDTMANATIVGGLIAAAEGMKAIN